MKEGKSMEKAAEERYPLTKCGHKATEDNLNWASELQRAAFIAGWQEQDKEIERLKGLLQETFIDYCIQKYGRLDIPLDKDDKEKMWQQFKTENNL